MATYTQAWDAADYSVNASDSDQNTATVYYIVQGAADEATAISTVMTATDLATYQSLPRQSASISERLTETDWKVEVHYGVDSGGSGGTSEKPANHYTFEVSGKSERIVFGYSQEKFPSSAPTPQAGIRNGEGVETLVPEARFSETRHFSDSKVTAAYQRTAMGLVGKTNSSTFEGYSAGTVLFLGCSGSRTGNGKWELTFQFAVDFGETGITIGSITGIERKPWNVLWVDYKKAESSGAVVRAAKAAYSVQIYQSGDFSDLGL